MLSNLQILEAFALMSAQALGTYKQIGQIRLQMGHTHRAVGTTQIFYYNNAPMSVYVFINSVEVPSVWQIESADQSICSCSLDAYLPMLPVLEYTHCLGQFRDGHMHK